MKHALWLMVLVCLPYSLGAVAGDLAELLAGQWGRTAVALVFLAVALIALKSLVGSYARNRRLPL